MLSNFYAILNAEEGVKSLFAMRLLILILLFFCFVMCGSDFKTGQFLDARGPQQSSSSTNKVIGFFHKICCIAFYLVWPAVVKAKWARRIQRKSQVLNDWHLPHATLSLQGVLICLKLFNFRFLRLRLVLVLSVLLLSIGRYQSQSHPNRYYQVVQKYEIDRSFKPHLEDRTEVTYKDHRPLRDKSSGYHRQQVS